ncbi:MAG: LysR family transcriptional regulator [Oscillospiraceae bacterium]|nr:LysR family transcriptional regulator [Oscillospiraceae bacterium]
MELRHIRYFLAVAEEMNFTRAAEKLCIAQPPLSRQIKDLEEELGVKLFLRKPHALQLTEEGQVFRQYAVRVLDLVQKSAEDVKEIHTGLHGTLYLASVEGHAPALFAQWIAGFQQENPNVTYNLWNGSSDDVINRLMKGLCDLAIIVEPHNAEGVHALPVYSEPWVAMIPQSCPLAAEPGDTVDFQRVTQYDLIIPSRESRLQEILGWTESDEGVLNIRCRMSHMLNAYELTRRNVGITIYPASADIGSDPSVRVKRLVNPEVWASYVLIWDKSRRLPHVAEEFLRHVQQQYAGR